MHASTLFPFQVAAHLHSSLYLSSHPYITQFHINWRIAFWRDIVFTSIQISLQTPYWNACIKGMSKSFFKDDESLNPPLSKTYKSHMNSIWLCHNIIHVWFWLKFPTKCVKCVAFQFDAPFLKCTHGWLNWVRILIKTMNEVNWV
jgi:hypothetical protein